MQQRPGMREWAQALGLSIVFVWGVLIALALMSGAAGMLMPVVRWVRGAEAAEQAPAAGNPAEAGDAATQSASGQPSGKETADSREIALLIRQLGDPAYSVRQRATKRLIELGIVCQPLLIQALEDNDAEVRSRAGQVLAQVVEADFHFRLEAFANDLEGRQQHTLPCWGRFSQVFGQDKVSRSLFVEMQKAEPALLEALDSNPKLSGELLVTRMQSIRQSLPLPLRDGGGQPLIALGTICSLLFVSGAEGVAVSDQDALQLFNLIHQQTFRNSLASHDRAILLKRLLGTWIVHNSSAALVHQNFVLAFAYDLKEGLDLALKLLARDGNAQQPAIRQDALVAIGRFGNHEHIALVESWLKDDSPCLPVQQQGNDPRQPQVRDVALAVLIHLSGQELKDYGLDHVQLNFQTLPQCGTIAFPDSLTRKAALRKWDQWAGRGGAGKASAAAGPASPPRDGKPAKDATEGSGDAAAKGGQAAAPRPSELEP